MNNKIYFYFFVKISMNSALFLSYLLFCLVMTSTPGPNNALVMLSGARFGLKKTFPLILGIACGVALQLIAIGLGLNQIFQWFPILQLLFSLIGTAYILWLAWKIATSGPLQMRLEEKPSLGFVQGAMFQWVNPKAWIMSISTIATYFAVNHQFSAILYAALILLLISIPCVGIWAVAGKLLRRLLMQPKFALIFNVTMALALLLAVLPACLQFIKLQA
jgi:threonine/homoserine/homoserine lactone efflux protein